MEGWMTDRVDTPLTLTAEQGQELTALIRGHSTPQKLAERARIIILAADGIGVGETARRLGIWRKTASRWRKRWQTADTSKTTAERLSDAPRSGAAFASSRRSRSVPSSRCKRTFIVSDKRSLV
jgi:hypothetical protein